MKNETFMGLRNVARRIAQKEIIFEINDSTQSYTDGTQIVISKESNDDTRLAQGLTAHEAGHIGYGSFIKILDNLLKKLLVKYELPNYVCRNIINVIEDCRIDLINKKIFPGAYESLRNYTYSFLDRYIKNKNILCDLNLYFEGGYEGYETFPNKYDLNEKELVKIKKIKQIIHSDSSPSMTIITSNMLADILSNHHVKDFNKNTFSGIKSDSKHSDEEKSEEKDLMTITDYVSCIDPDKSLEQVYPSSKSGKKKKDELPSGVKKALKKLDDSIKHKIKNVEENTFEEICKRKDPRKVTQVNITDFFIDKIVYYPRYKHIIAKNRVLISRMKQYFSKVKIDKGMEKFHKSGRINNTFVRAVTSNYNFKRCYSRKVESKMPKICLMIDCSYSMSGDKIKYAKEALVVFHESLKDVANLRIVMFLGKYDAINVVIKDYDQSVDINNFDKFGLSKTNTENLDGESILHEAKIIGKDGVIIVISDGQPCAYNYRLKEALPHVELARKIVKKIFAFSVDIMGDWLPQMYGKGNYVKMNSSDKSDIQHKLMKICKLIVSKMI